MDLRARRARFDFVYIDASHNAIDVRHDALMSWRMLNVDGTTVFDDCTWKDDVDDCLVQPSRCDPVFPSLYGARGQDETGGKPAVGDQGAQSHSSES